MKHSKGIRLLHKYLYGKPDAEEKARVEKWYEEADESHVLDTGELATIKEQLYQRTWSELNSENVLPLYKRPFFRLMAAAVLIICIGGSYFLFTGKSKSEATLVNSPAQQLPNDVAPPVSNKAILTLADGTHIVLDSAGNGALAQQGNVVVAKLNNGKIAYNVGNGGNDKIQYNTLRVPKGSKPVQMVLADGSEVWLNVASSITYPTAFTGTERKVTITGEVYFEVAHNAAMPFKVQKDGVEVQVLGTHFNVNAYEDERSLRVTLLEGSVKVSRDDSKSLIIKPGQQAAVREAQSNNEIKLVNNVDMEEVMAWKNGWFNFNSLQVPDIMRQLEKWYDMDVLYEGKISQKHFSGIVSRDNNISEVLKIMEQAGIKFKIEGKKVMVKG